MATLADQNVVKSFISGCLLLEDLSIQNCIFARFRTLEISSRTLKNLTIFSDCFVGCNEGLPNIELKVSCPCLVRFNFEGKTALDFSFEESLSLENVFFFVRVDDETQENGHAICKALKAFSGAKVLKVDQPFLELLHVVPAAFKLCFGSFCSVKSLKVVLCMTKSQIITTINLLKCCPNLETLILYFDFDEDEEGEWRNWQHPDEEIHCMTYKVKVVELFHNGPHENHIKLVGFLLKHGHALEVMRMYWRGSVVRRKKFVEGVTKLSKSSSKAVLKFLEPVPEDRMYYP